MQESAGSTALQEQGDGDLWSRYLNGTGIFEIGIEMTCTLILMV